MLPLYSPFFHKKNSTNLANTPEKKLLRDEHKSSISVVLAVVRIDGLQLRYASTCLQNNKEIVLAAVRQCEHAYWYASLKLQNDKDVIQEKSNHYFRRMSFKSSDYSSSEASKNIPVPARNIYTCEEDDFYFPTKTQSKINDMSYNDANSSESDEENMFKMEL